MSFLLKLSHLPKKNLRIMLAEMVYRAFTIVGLTSNLNDFETNATVIVLIKLY